MSCFHPMKAFPCGKSEKRPYRITSYRVKGINDRGEYVYTDDYSGDETVTRQFIEIPCGHCAGCRADKAKEWSDRLIMESKYCDPDSMYFITLTYDEENLRRVGYVDKFGEVIDRLKSNRGTLDKRDIQLFVKRLREHLPMIESGITYVVNTARRPIGPITMELSTVCTCETGSYKNQEGLRLVIPITLAVNWNEFGVMDSFRLSLPTSSHASTLHSMLLKNLEQSRPRPGESEDKNQSLV